MDFDIEEDLEIFRTFFAKRPEVSKLSLTNDLKRYYLPFIQKLISLKSQKNSPDGLIVGVSAIQGAGKTTQGEIASILLNHFGHSTISLSIDDHYITHKQLNELREKDPRYIKRGVTHDIPLAIKSLTALKTMKNGDTVELPIYDKGVEHGDGDRIGWKKVSQKPDFIFYDGWMLGARKVEDDSIFDSGLPALDTPEHIQFAKDINQKLVEYEPLWSLFDFLNVLYVVNYQDSLKWRDQAEDTLREKGQGMTHEQIKEFVYYFWRSVHPAIHIKNLSHDQLHTKQVVIINDDHSIEEILTPSEVAEKYP